jgi:glutamate carboxypeptidase
VAIRHQSGVIFACLRARWQYTEGNPRTEVLAARAQAIYAELGKKLALEGSGGAGDANYTAAVGASTLDGFGPVGGNFHGEDEYVELNSIAPRLYLLVRMIIESRAKP